MLRVIRELEPRLVLVENVPGLLSRGLPVVLHGLASAGYSGRWFTVSAAEVGSCHLRVRVFIVAKRAAGAELDAPDRLGDLDPSGWLKPQESLFGDPDLVLKLGRRGRWSARALYEEDATMALSDEEADDLTLLPTPSALESTPTAEYVAELRETGVDPEARLYLPGRKWHSQRTLSRIAPLIPVALLPTPTAGDAKASGSRNLEGSNAHAGVSLTDAVRFGNSETPRKLLPTPQAADADRGPDYAAATREGTGGDSLVTTVAKMLPTPAARDAKGAYFDSRDGGPDLTSAVREVEQIALLPTVANPQNPGAGGDLAAAVRHGPGRRNNTGTDSMGRPNTGRPSKLLPTPVKSDFFGSRNSTAKRRDDSTGNAGDTLTDAIWKTQGAPEWASVKEGTKMLPTPTAADGDRTSEQGPRFYLGGGDNLTLLGAARRAVSDWGVYEDAVARWERVFGWDAPAPTDEKARLEPLFVEWMMGQDPGWTEVEGVPRTERLKMLGNSVHIQCGIKVVAELGKLERELTGLD
jgi:hypothetical protein